MNAEGDPMTLQDAQLSDHKEEVSKEDTSASGGRYSKRV